MGREPQGKLGILKRIITSKIILKCDPGLSSTNYQLAIVEKFPSGVYVDTFQLNNLEQQNQQWQVLINEAIDVEMPEYLSQEFEAYFYVILRNVNEHQMEANISVPIHLRYHKPSENPDEYYVNVFIHNPKLYLKNDQKELSSCFKSTEQILFSCDKHNKAVCDWHSVPYFAQNENGLRVSVPVGHSEDEILVTYITIFITCIGSIYIVYLLCKMDNIHQKQL
ncbi:Phosphatidylinositol-glycan biosynthesis class X protein [Nymphon striatum]|nr:Phosphatidylinositol-glycan biosynthesis class X protein [Nymphon striatum]